MDGICGTHKVLVGKLEGKRSLERPRHRWGLILGWKGNSLCVCEGLYYIHVTQDEVQRQAIVNMVLKLRVL
jgi:hypothetical protein